MMEKAGGQWTLQYTGCPFGFSVRISHRLFHHIAIKPGLFKHHAVSLVGIAAGCSHTVIVPDIYHQAFLIRFRYFSTSIICLLFTFVMCKVFSGY